MKRPENLVVLTSAEAEWLARNIFKTMAILEAGATKDSKILERTTYRVLSSLTDDAERIGKILVAFGDEPYEIELMLSKKQKSVVQDLVNKTAMTLESRILPEYQQRGLMDYIDDTKFKIGLLKTMARKFK